MEIRQKKVLGGQELKFLHPNKSMVKYLSSNKELIFLIFISTIFAIFFVYDGFAAPDSIRYAIGIQSIAQNGFKEITRVFNGEMSFGYYLLISLIERVFDHSLSLSALINNINAIFSVLMVCFLFSL